MAKPKKSSKILKFTTKAERKAKEMEETILSMFTPEEIEAIKKDLNQ